MKVLVFLFSFFILGFVPQATSQQLDSLYAMLDVRRPDSVKYLILSQIGKIHYRSSKYNKALVRFKDVLKYKESILDTAGMINMYLWSSMCEEEIGDFDAAIAHNNKAFDLSNSILDYESLVISLNNLGIIYKNQGDYPKALQTYQLGVDISSGIEDKTYLAAFYENIGIVHSNQSNFVSALSAYTQALRIYEELQLYNYIAELNLNIGIIYRQNKEYKKAIDYYKTALLVEIESRDTSGMQRAYQNIGNAYLEWNRLELAKENLLASFRLNLSIERDCFRGDAAAIAHLYLLQKDLDSAEYFINMEWESIAKCNTMRLLPSAAYIYGRILAAQNFQSKALEYFHLSLSKAEEMGQLSTVRDASYELFDIYKSKGNAKKALSFHEKFQTSSDSLFNQEDTRKLAWLEANYKMEQVSDSLMALKANDERLLNNEIRAQKQRLNFTIISAIVVLVFLIILYLYYKQKRELIYQRDINNERKKSFGAVINATENERKRIAKDLHDGVVQQMAAIKLMMNGFSRNTDNNNSVEMKETAQMLEQTIGDIRDISHQMMPKVLVEAGLVAAIKDNANAFLESSGIDVEFEHHNISGRYTDQIEVSIYRIFQELINNIVKHAKASHVDIQLMENNQSIILIVEDDGVGLDPNKNSNGGIGLSNISSRLSPLDGKMNISSGINTGTIATIVIPV